MGEALKQFVRCVFIRDGNKFLRTKQSYFRMCPHVVSRESSVAWIFHFLRTICLPSARARAGAPRSVRAIQRRCNGTDAIRASVFIFHISVRDFLSARDKGMQ